MCLEERSRTMRVAAAKLKIGKCVIIHSFAVEKKMRVDLQLSIHFSLNPALGCHCVTMLNLNVEKQMCNELFCELQVRPTTVLFRAFVSSVTEF